MCFPQYPFLKIGEEILIFRALRDFLRIVLTENFARAKNGPQGARQLIKCKVLIVHCSSASSRAVNQKSAQKRLRVGFMPVA